MNWKLGFGFLAAVVSCQANAQCTGSGCPFLPSSAPGITSSQAATSYVQCLGVDDTATIRAAISSGFKNVGLSGSCKITGTLTPVSNQSIQGLDASTSIALVSASVSRVFDLATLSNVILSNLTLNGSQAAAGGDFIRIQNTTNSALYNLTLVSPPANSNGCIDISQSSTGNLISGGSITSCAGHGISLNSINVKGNSILNVRFSGSAQMNIHMYGTPTGGPSRNLVQGTYSTSSGLESIALDYSSFENRIIGNHAEGSGDNGISISGYRNTVVGNEVIGNQKAGIYIWGSQNTITGNVGIDNDLTSAAFWACIGTNGNFGGTGQNNVIVGNSCDDDQAVPTQPGILEAAPSYTAWAQGQSITTNNYRVNGLNIYQAAGSGTTGATAPTCTSGSCSDGTVTWNYLNSFLGSFATSETISGNSIQRFAGTSAYTYNGYNYLNFGTGSINVVLGSGTPASALTAPVGTLYLRSDGGASATLYVKESGTSNSGWVAK